MGFDLYFYAFKNKAQDIQEPNLTEIAKFLQSRNLTSDFQNDDVLVDKSTNKYLSFDCIPSEFELSRSEPDKPITGSLHHASLTQSECDFLYHLCVAGGLMIVNPQGNPKRNFPMWIIPNNNHTLDDLPDDEENMFAFIQSAEELRMVLTESHDSFLNYRDQVLKNISKS